MELELIILSVISMILLNYIIPIWNWSNLILFLLFQSKYITLFLYGIGATLDVVNSCNSVGLHYSYMELELFPFCLFKLFCLYYIIPIWNWSKNIQVIVLHKILITLFLYGIGAYTDIIHCPLKDGNYIIPIWNWSKSKNSSFSNWPFITLFLYGIGAEVLFFPLFAIILLHYSYMELEPFFSPVRP